MAWVRGIHHVEMLTHKLGKTCDYFTNKLGFNIFCILKDGKTYRAAVRNGKAIFVLRNPDYFAVDKCSSTYAAYLANMVTPQVDTVFDVALEVQNVRHAVEKVVDNGGHLLMAPTVLNDYHGQIEMAVIKSLVGNVIHTLLNTSKYHGLFLPGYTSYKPCIAYKNRHDFHTYLTETGLSFHHDQPTFQYVSNFDHLTFACYENQSNRILQWYENTFDMKRCPVNINEDSTEGFVVKHGLSGMKLKAFDYWKCSTSGVETQNKAFKFVLAEPISGNGPNQINTFLNEHEGPGIQHIGLHVDDICMTATQLNERGVSFMEPPSEYYSEVGKLAEIREMNIDQLVLKRNGILLDKEEDAVCPWDNTKQGYLLQVFTKPIFSRDTFFLELIQRCGARGFGAGNISALWRAVDAHLKRSNRA